MVLPFHVFCDHVEGVSGPDVAYRVAALVGGAVDGVGWAGLSHVVGKGGVGLQGVASGYCHWGGISLHLITYLVLGGGVVNNVFVNNKHSLVQILTSRFSLISV